MQAPEGIALPSSGLAVVTVPPHAHPKPDMDRGLALPERVGLWTAVPLLWP